MKGYRVAKTADGRHVPDTHPEAAYLAYSQHDDVPKDVLREAFPNGAKSGAKPEDKQSASSEDKGRGTHDTGKRQEATQHRSK